jgi:hypothetical protein
MGFNTTEQRERGQKFFTKMFAVSAAVPGMSCGLSVPSLSFAQHATWTTRKSCVYWWFIELYRNKTGKVRGLFFFLLSSGLWMHWPCVVYHRSGICIVMCQWLHTGLGLIIAFIEHLWFTLTDLHTLPVTTAHTKSSLAIARWQLLTVRIPLLPCSWAAANRQLWLLSRD